MIGQLGGAGAFEGFHDDGKVVGMNRRTQPDQIKRSLAVFEAEYLAEFGRSEYVAAVDVKTPVAAKAEGRHQFEHFGITQSNKKVLGLVGLVRMLNPGCQLQIISRPTAS
jgi:hypothetical protein